MADHRSLYKTSPGSGEADSADEPIDRRRRRLLNEQKAQRRQARDEQRGPLIQQILVDSADEDDDEIDEDDGENVEEELRVDNPDATMDDANRPNRRCRRGGRAFRDPKAKRFNHHVQLSEWLRQRPEDMPNSWIMVVCPRGRRCLVVAHKGRTKVFAKSGAFVRHFRSSLPGDSHKGHPADATILDCVQAPDGGLWVLDVLVFGRLELADCDATFRFYWLEEKFTDGGWDVAGQQVENRLRVAPRVDCLDEELLKDMMAKPAFDVGEGEITPTVDGLLFYHRESVYVHGRTPLVGWLYPFMVGEVLGWTHLPMHPSWLKIKAPEDVGGAVEYMDRFDERQKNNLCDKRRRQRHRRTLRRRAMNAEVNDGEEGDADKDDADDADKDDVADAEQMLEESGECVDDVYYDNDDDETSNPDLVA